MKYLPLFLLLFTLSCSNAEKPRFVQFDEIIHYRIEFADDVELYNLIKSKNSADNLLGEILNRRAPYNLKDSASLKMIDEKFIKRKIQKSQHQTTANCILFKPVTDNMTTTTCEPIYRDILFFRHKNKITGVAKICFECEQHELIGFKYDENDFFTEIDFKKLKTIL